MKRDIRSAGLKALKSIPLATRTKKSQEIVAQVLKELKPYKNISVFESFDWEVDTIPLIESLLKDGKNVYVPKVISQEEMIMIDIDTQDVANKDDIEVIIVPCVSFWNKCRIGYGRGYYDRYLKDFKGRTILIAFKEQERQFTPDQFDVPVQEMIIK